MARPVVTDFSTPFTISLFFDNRDYLSKGDDIGSIKLSVWGRRQSKRKRYSTKLFCTAEVFEAVSGQHTKARTGKGRGAARKVIDRPPLSAQQKNKLKLEVFAEHYKTLKMKFLQLAVQIFLMLLRMLLKITMTNSSGNLPHEKELL